ncbi:MAG: hypothetical protein GY744_10885 [Gammaproteobacteria bacterium]|nr:hypothetical protein [Gammaproteobacteria bacterium]
MITYEELHDEIHEITEISNVFLYLIENRKMCDSQVTCDLFFEYVEKVKNHLKTHDTAIYSLILQEGDSKAKDTAANFLSGSIEIKKIFDSYLKSCSKRNHPKLLILDHQRFVTETREMFRLVLDRLQHEIEQLYPLLKSISGDMKKVA